MKPTIEICCGSYYDAKQAALGGARQIELNSALMLGGLTPSVDTLTMVKTDFPVLKVIAMVRPRGAGFCYSEEDFTVMAAECRTLVTNGADGIAFGCLKEDASFDMEKIKQMMDIIKGMGKEAVIHRAFDCSADPFAAAEQLIAVGVDRILTSGLKPKAIDGHEVLKELHHRYGSEIQILAGSGVNVSNARTLMDLTGLTRIHSSCKDWKTDPTTVQNEVSYSIASGDQELCYDVVSAALVEELIASTALHKFR
ncbi:MAG: copper homeostasis protein CutC [Lachnospiraceae bacterium]